MGSLSSARVNRSIYPHKTTQGARLPGWPEVNCEHLARATGLHATHVRNVLSGRSGTTLNYIEKLAEALQMEPGKVISRIIAAREKDDERIELAKQRWAARQTGRKRIGDSGLINGR